MESVSADGNDEIFFYSACGNEKRYQGRFLGRCDNENW
jgi:hypothetical protein